MVGIIRRGTLRAVLATVILGTVTTACGVGPDEDIETIQGYIQAPGCGEVASDSVCACTNSQFTGQCMEFKASKKLYMNISQSPYSALNDTISSLWVGPSARARFCQHPGMGGVCILQAGSSPNGWFNYNLHIGSEFGGYCNQDFPWLCQADQISSIRVDNLAENCQSPGINKIAIFDGTNYTGDCVILGMRASGGGNLVGGYPDPASNPDTLDGQIGGGFGLPNDTISSVKVGGWSPSGSLARFGLWDGVNLTGASIVAAGSRPDLAAYGFNNRATSISIVNAN